LLDFKKNLTVLDRCSKNTQISNFMEISRLEVELFQADGRTVRHDEANSRFPEFCNALKNPCSVPKEDQVSGLYMDLYSVA